MQEALLDCPEAHYATVDLLFGDRAVEAWQQGAREKHYLNKLGKCVTKTFQSEDSFQAYLAGLEDACPHDDSFIVTRVSLNPV